MQKTFTNTGTEFSAWRAAEAFLSERGFSVGSTQKGAASGILFGDFKISKWRNLSPKERNQLHGTVHALDIRSGSAVVTLRESAPAEAKAAFLREILWCCHVRGPDDVMACDDKEHAERVAGALSKQFKALSGKMDVMFDPVAAPWPHSAEAHAGDLSSPSVDYAAVIASARLPLVAA
ncbi:hypothetical protein [Ferrovibrio terrae]|uniref:hypothetical protein n=1 Tax=Ferrovibrio terrae TaxID=2594003 RepID=UPI0031379378